jgi:hypothetical protein
MLPARLIEGILEVFGMDLVAGTRDPIDMLGSYRLSKYPGAENDRTSEQGDLFPLLKGHDKPVAV